VDIDWDIGCRFIQYLIASDHFFLFFFSTLTAFVAKFMSVYKIFLIATFGWRVMICLSMLHSSCINSWILHTWRVFSHALVKVLSSCMHNVIVMTRLWWFWFVEMICFIKLCTWNYVEFSHLPIPTQVFHVEGFFILKNACLFLI
jgi:hypothetical protein